MLLRTVIVATADTDSPSAAEWLANSEVVARLMESAVTSTRSRTMGSVAVRTEARWRAEGKFPAYFAKCPDCAP